MKISKQFQELWEIKLVNSARNSSINWSVPFLRFIAHLHWSLAQSSELVNFAGTVFVIKPDALDSNYSNENYRLGNRC